MIRMADENTNSYTKSNISIEVNSIETVKEEFENLKQISATNSSPSCELISEIITDKSIVHENNSYNICKLSEVEIDVGSCNQFPEKEDHQLLSTSISSHTEDSLNGVSVVNVSAHAFSNGQSKDFNGQTLVNHLEEGPKITIPASQLPVFLSNSPELNKMSIVTDQISAPPIIGSEVYGSTTDQISAPPIIGSDICSSTTDQVSAPPIIGSDICGSTTDKISAPTIIRNDMCSSTTDQVSAPPITGSDVCSSTTDQVSAPPIIGSDVIGSTTDQVSAPLISGSDVCGSTTDQVSAPPIIGIDVCSSTTDQVSAPPVIGSDVCGSSTDQISAPLIMRSDVCSSTISLRTELAAQREMSTMSGDVGPAVSIAPKPTADDESGQCSNTSNVKNEPQQPTASTESTVKPTPEDEPKVKVKKTPNDFIFGKVLGEGSYSTVHLAKEVSTQREFAVKICDKKHLIRERKTHFVMREKEVLMKLDHPFFIKLAYTFQDHDRLYFVITFARNGELISYLHKLSAFDMDCTRFYTAEVASALEYLQSLNIVHRDLKPENILLSEDFHIKITDFGTSKVLTSATPASNQEKETKTKRKNSFVGTAEYVSPEVLNNLPANFGTDLWAFGCIIFQCLSGSLPFRSGNEFQTFQKIVKADYEFPEGFPQLAKDLILRLLVLDSNQRLGMELTGGMAALKMHEFYKGIDWENLPNCTPPKLMPYLPATSHNPEFWGQDERTGFDDERLAEIITGQTVDSFRSPELEVVTALPSVQEQEAKKKKFQTQKTENEFHRYVENNLILKQGFVDKRKGLFARKRMLLLTEGPHLYYVDAHNKVLKGEIPWSEELRPEAKNFKIFFVHTPNRTYYLESRNPDAQQWVQAIQEVWQRYFGHKDKQDR